MKTMFKVMNYIKKYWFFVIASIFFATITVISTLYIPILTGDIIDRIVGVDQVDFAGIIEILKIMLVIIVITGIAQWLMNVCNNHITYHVVQDIRKQAFEKIQVLPLKYLDRQSNGDVVSRIITDVDQFSEGLLLGFSQLFTGIITIVGTLIFMLREDVVITLVVVCITPVSLFVASFIAKRTYKMFQLQSKERGTQTQLIEEVIGNQKLVQAFSYEDTSLEQFNEMNDTLADYSTKAIFYSSITNPATRFVNGLVYTGVGIVGAISVINGGISVGTLTCFLSYANQYTKPFNEISSVFTEFQNAIACAERIFMLIEETPQQADAISAIEKTVVQGNMELKNVSFSYVPEKPFMEHLHLSVKSGQRVAIVGPTGCGKTTLINLFMRFYDITGGDILVDETSIFDYKRGNLRTHFGMVLQETWLKGGTIRENITMGQDKVSDEEMIEAAKACHAHSFIKRFADGYDTVISEGAEELSAGQRQLLCITRVMICKPQILILDEATSSIDTRTELQIQKAFAKLMKGKTSFIIAHRLSTIKDADIILVMKDGNIIESGNHDTLLAQKGFYANLYQSQFVLATK